MTNLIDAVMTAWNSSVRFATGCGVANGVTVAFSKYGFVSDVRTWKYRYR